MGEWYLEQAQNMPSLPASPWLNSAAPPEISGRVTLLWVWDYTCINSLSMLPVVREWHQRYASLGVAVIGVHTPRFSFGRELQQVAWAVQQLNIRFPVYADNDEYLWTALENRFWPTVYLIDSEGAIRYRQEGAGLFEQTEAALQQLIRDAFPHVDLPPIIAPPYAVRPSITRRPTISEMRAGLRGGALGNPQGYAAGLPVLYQLPDEFSPEHFYVSGAWAAGDEFLSYQGRLEGLLLLNYAATQVYAVLSPHPDPVERTVHPAAVPVEIWQDDRPIPLERLGGDVLDDGRMVVDRPRVYQLVQNPKTEPHTLTLRVRSPGFACYAFVFRAEFSE
ncbi:MAG: hypothetical protein D6712_08910 [Chloroflexi bacterium]|nr:MAG: hypothetical protein D6712_08910 [Chloroflexota bacterium]